MNDSLYRRHLRQLLEANEEKLTKFREGKNVYLPLAPHTGNLINKNVPKWSSPTIPDQSRTGGPYQLRTVGSSMIIEFISVGLASALFEEFGHERKKLEEIRGPVVEDHEEGIKEESGELDRTLQSLLLWTFSQTNKFPGVRHVPRCQKVIKELSIGVSQKP